MEKGSAVRSMRAAVKQAIVGIVPLLKDRLYDMQPPVEGGEESYGVIAFGVYAHGNQ